MQVYKILTDPGYTGHFTLSIMDKIKEKTASYILLEAQKDKMTANGIK